jgi:hypothetical protein
LLEVRLDVARQRIDLEPIGVVGVVAGGTHPRPEVRVGGDDLVELEACQTLDDEA